MDDMEGIEGMDDSLYDLESVDYSSLSVALAEQLQGVDGHFNMLPYLEPSADLSQLLILNRRYQQTLREQLVAVEEAQKTTRELQRWLKMLETQLRNRKKPTDGVFALPRAIVDRRGNTPPEDAETRHYRQVLMEYNRALRFTLRWSERERFCLARGVRQQNRLLLVDQILDGEHILGYMGYGRVQVYEQAVETVRRMSERELEMNLEGLDWTQMSISHVPSRSADDCRIQWTTNDHPVISHAPFLPEEKERLAALVKKYGPRGEWVTIAKSLQSNRTAWQCLAQWQLRNNRARGGGKWTADEDRILIEGVRMGGLDSWAEISELLDGRSVSQCTHRWSKTLDPSKRIGRWTETEDAWLLAAVRRLGCMNWALIRDFVPRRTDVQCRERYMNVLHPNLIHNIFSPEEEETLRRAVEKYGEGRWSLVAAMLRTRTDNQCRRRWMSMRTGKPEKPRKRLGRPKKPTKPPRGRPRKRHVENKEPDEADGSGRVDEAGELGKVGESSNSGKSINSRKSANSERPNNLGKSTSSENSGESDNPEKSTHSTRLKRSKKSNK
ncbi:Homeo-like domain-containing protein [Paramicrosporidium saccamoebae]|uniref:Homeo-like domain-containing protein n=1 Tax=Paramicrosporidium saccamoebae TaxID=1246581 RepID=A0A2H9TN10_9FUNG|nr:Homeo-like domain-containing protein [Paramicrosporidium saccamoebae]